MITYQLETRNSKLFSLYKLCLLTLKMASLLLMSLWMYPQMVFVQAGDDDGEFEEGQVVVKLNSSSGATIDDINTTYNTTILETVLASRGIYLLQVAVGQDVEELVGLMQSDPRLFYAEPNFIGEAPEADPSETWAWGGYDPGPMTTQYAADMLNLDEAHTISLGAGVVVAVVDTGVQLDHPGLVGYLTGNGYDFVNDDTIPEDEFNGLDDDGDTLIDEAAGHGTHVAGIVNLVAPQAEVMPLRVLDSDGRGNVFLVAEAILYAVEHGADVVNLSLGTTADSDLLAEMVEDAVANGVVLVAAAGNWNSSSEQYPAAEEEVIAVASIGPDGTKSPFSNYGSWVDISAPGESIYSTFPTDGYAQWSGTSMATPFIAGQAALICSIFPALSGQQILALIQSTAQPIDDVNPDYVGLLGAGQVDIWASLTQLPLFRLFLPSVRSH